MPRDGVKPVILASAWNKDSPAPRARSRAANRADGRDYNSAQPQTVVVVCSNSVQDWPTALKHTR